jgi:translocation protein SEC63
MGFKEAFTRGQEEENNLLFDDDAFYYFAISMLTIIILPLAYSVLKPILLQVICRRDANLFKRA